MCLFVNINYIFYLGIISHNSQDSYLGCICWSTCDNEKFQESATNITQKHYSETLLKTLSSQSHAEERQS